MRPRLLALDLDGTLLTEDSELPMGHVRAVQAIRRMGVQVAIATGRGLMTTQWVWNELQLDTPLVCFNGGWVGLPGQPLIAQRTLNEYDVQDVFAALDGHQGTACCYPDATTWIMDRETEHTHTWRIRYRTDIVIRTDLRQTWRGDSLKMMYVADPDRIPLIRDHLIATFSRRFHVVISQPDRLEILPTAITKAWGLAHLTEYLHIPRESVWAVGDADNDLEMLAWAAHGCAMGQASPRVRAAARHILPGIDARGLCALVPMIEKELAAYS